MKNIINNDITVIATIEKPKFEIGGSVGYAYELIKKWCSPS